MQQKDSLEYTSVHFAPRLCPEWPFFFNVLLAGIGLASGLLTQARHETQLPHFGKSEGLLRWVRRLACPPAYAGGIARLVLPPLLPCLQGATHSDPTAGVRSTGRADAPCGL